MADPLHETAGPGIAWTLGNISEAFPGVATPLSWAFWGPACESGARLGFARLGVLSRAELPIPDDVGERFGSIMFGRACGNIDLFARMGERLPGVDPETMEEQLFGSSRDVERHSTVRRYPFIAARMPAEIALTPRRARRVYSDTRVWWSNTLLAVAGNPDRARAAYHEASAQFTRNMALQTIVSMVSTGVFDALTALAEEARGDHSAARLVTGHGGMVESALADDLWRVARDGGSRDLFLAVHGYQGPDAGQLHNAVWREQPEQLDEVLGLYRGMRESDSPPARERRQRKRREEAERELLSSLPPLGRARARLLMSMAKAWVGMREAAKSGYLMSVDIARAASKVIGTDLAARRLLAEPDDVFYLTASELLAGSVDPEAIDARKRRRAELMELALPDAWIGEPTPVPLADDLGDGQDRITGVGVSPGIVEGRARVVHDPNAAELEHGEILVCATTDPSWVSLFLAAGAAVIDVGGHLSHGAIVARELGLPCVINTKNGTRRVQTGDLVRVDGASGAVEVRESVTAGPVS